MLNKAKKSPYTAIVWMLLSCMIHIVLFRSKVNLDIQIWQRLLYLILAVCLTLPLHELLHFAMMKVFGAHNVQIKVMKSPMGFPTLGTVAQAQFTKRQNVVIYLAPFVVLTLLLDVIFLFCTKIELVFLIVSICNCVGAFYDIIDSLIAMNG